MRLVPHPRRRHPGSPGSQGRTASCRCPYAASLPGCPSRHGSRFGALPLATRASGRRRQPCQLLASTEPLPPLLFNEPTLRWWASQQLLSPERWLMMHSKRRVLSGPKHSLGHPCLLLQLQVRLGTEALGASNHHLCFPQYMLWIPRRQDSVLFDCRISSRPKEMPPAATAAESAANVVARGCVAAAAAAASAAASAAALRSRASPLRTGCISGASLVHAEPAPRPASAARLESPARTPSGAADVDGHVARSLERIFFGLARPVSIEPPEPC